MSAQRRWTIEVCLSCDRLAVWPFCEHKPDRYVPDGTRWTQTLVVRPISRGGGKP